MQHFVIITGLSGSGKHSAVKTFEDLGYFCVDNLPIKLLPTFAELCQRSGENLERAVAVLDVREPHFLDEFAEIYCSLRNRQPHPQLFFFEASDDVLLRRFSETRRPHPMSNRDRKRRSLPEAIAAERERLKPIRSLAENVIDTSEHTVHSLKKALLEVLHPEETQTRMQITVMSFGFKHGLPIESDVVLDVRFLPNPYFVPELRDQTGKQKGVIDFLKKNQEVVETQKRFADLLEFIVPRYAREGRSYLTIAIGCTGGRHRSVMTAEVLGRNLKKLGYSVRVLHRDIEKK